MFDILLKKTGTSLKDFLSGLLYPLQSLSNTAEEQNEDHIRRLDYNGQKMVLQKALNEEMYGISDGPIIVETYQTTDTTLFFYEPSEFISIYFYEPSEYDTVYFFEPSEASISPADFVVKIPFDDATTEFIRQVTAFTNLYKLAGKTFLVNDESMIAEKTLTTAEILAGFATPVDIIPAPGAGKIIVPLLFADQYDFAGAAFATNTDYHYEINGVDVSGTITGMLNAAADKFSNKKALDLTTLTSLINQPLKFKVNTGAPTAGGTSRLKTVIPYKIINVIV